jgi:hypothetical protein
MMMMISRRYVILLTCNPASLSSCKRITVTRAIVLPFLHELNSHGGLVPLVPDVLQPGAQGAVSTSNLALAHHQAPSMTTGEELS